MLSILIPIYNFSVVKLVQSLRQQCVQSNITFEIICFDDQSSKKFKKENQVVGALFGVSYLELSENLGRAKIRNWLAKSANFSHLIFMDCDSEVTNKNYIKNYLQLIDNGKQVVCGGRVYSNKAPRSKKRRLHWKYGCKREQLEANARNKNPYLSFHTNNFMIESSLFSQVKFDEQIKGYGYEDLQYAYQLKNKNINILHIDNPLLHLGLEMSHDFLDKTKEAIENLVFLHKRNSDFRIKLIDWYYTLKKYRLLPIFKKYYTYYRHKIELGLLAENPNLRYFDLFRLYYFTQVWETAAKISCDENKQ